MNFTAYNHVLVMIAAAICIGIASKEAITNIITELILPLLVFMSKKSISMIMYNSLLQHTMHIKWLNALITGLGKLMWILFTWVIVLYCTWIVFKYVITIDLVTQKVNMVELVASKLSNLKI